MSFRTTLFPSLAALGAIAAIHSPVSAQRTLTPAQQAENNRAATDLRTRIAATDARIATARRGGKLTRPRAAALHRQVAQTRASMTHLARLQGFVSAAEFASYDRTLGAIDLELDRRGVARSYGDDTLPSAEVTAFEKTDARLAYRDARIEYDARGCAVYRGTGRDGRVRDEPLLTPDRQPICVRR